jgi:hypothetical protein
LLFINIKMLNKQQSEKYFSLSTTRVHVYSLLNLTCKKHKNISLHNLPINPKWEAYLIQNIIIPISSLFLMEIQSLRFFLAVFNLSKESNAPLTWILYPIYNSIFFLITIHILLKKFLLLLCFLVLLLFSLVWNKNSLWALVTL